MRALRAYGLVLAIDSRNADDVLRLTADVGPMVDGIKIGVPTLLASGASLISRIRDGFDGPLIADLKVADIGIGPNSGVSAWSGTNKAIVETAVSAGIDYVICHTMVGPTGLGECVATAHSSGGKVLALPYMTHRGAELVFDHPLDIDYVSGSLAELGLKSINVRLVTLAGRKKAERGWRNSRVTFADLGVITSEELGVDGYIGPANKVEVLRDYRKLTSRLVVATGVGRQGGTLKGVYPVLGKNSAAIVGHAIYDKPDPAAACRAFLAERAECTGSR